MEAESVIMAIVLVFLGIEAVTDYRRKTISLYAGAAMTAAAAAYNAVSGRMSFAEMAAGCLTGGAVILAGIISKQKIGTGDGLILLVVGMWLGGFASFMTLAAGSTSAAVITLILLAAGKVKRGQQMGFVPFLLIGFVEVVLFV